MNIGLTIKELRRKADLTQEQLAELLNISASAVSQWETDRALPDVTLIPLLANIFRVSADVILGIDIEKNEEKIAKIIKESDNIMLENGGIERCERRTVMLRDAYLQFPRSHKIMLKLADSIVNEYSRKGIKDYEEVFELCNRILSESTDSIIRYETLELLGIAYVYADKKDEMMKIAEQMPPFRYSKEVFMLWKWEGDGDSILNERQKYLDRLINQIAMSLHLIACHCHDDGSWVYSLEDRIALWKQEVAFIEILFPDGDYYPLADTAVTACCFLESSYRNLGDVDNAIYWLGKGCDFAINYDTYDFEAAHTSPALRGYKPGGWIMENGMNKSAVILDYLINHKNSESIREDPRVIDMINRLEKVAIKI
ncbi:MAG: helix-turn-helix transcriptional regulator [Ruminococcaceae bacterium]|nr:helix-turn-helix transcriptional regulator [Oscillospiraceae bacterium]